MRAWLQPKRRPRRRTGFPSGAFHDRFALSYFLEKAVEVRQGEPKGAHRAAGTGCRGPPGSGYCIGTPDCPRAEEAGLASFNELFGVSLLIGSTLVGILGLERISGLRPAPGWRKTTAPRWTGEWGHRGAMRLVQGPVGVVGGPEWRWRMSGTGCGGPPWSLGAGEPLLAAHLSGILGGAVKTLPATTHRTRGTRHDPLSLS